MRYGSARWLVGARLPCIARAVCLRSGSRVPAVLHCTSCCAAHIQEVVDTPSSSTPAVNASQAIAGLPGVDPNDPAVQAALRNVSGQKEEGGEGKDKDSK